MDRQEPGFDFDVALAALRAHRASGNVFDQWGVELGKELATGLLPVVVGRTGSAGQDGSTAGLVTHFRSLQSAVNA